MEYTESFSVTFTDFYRDIPTLCGAKNSNKLCVPRHLVTWIPHTDDKKVNVNNSLQHWSGCMIVDMFMKFHYAICLGVHKMKLNAQTKHCSAKPEK